MARADRDKPNRHRAGSRGGAVAVNRILYADDCLNVLTDERALPSGSVDLIYLDPPFNSRSDYNLSFKGKDKSARPVAAFKDTWEWGEGERNALAAFEDDPATRQIARMIEVARHVDGPGPKRGLGAYLTNMAQRLIPMKRVLKPTGSIYLHCDPTASHYLKMLMDLIFGRANFRNEIVWHYKTGGVSKRWFGRKHDTIFLYSKTDNYVFNPLAEKSYLSHRYGFRNMEILEDDGGFYRMARMRDVWDIPALRGNQLESMGYPTQKPIALLERVVAASSNEGDVVLDPFCGCGTSLHVAHRMKRRWIGIDISRFAIGLIHGRLLSHFTDLPSIRMLGVPETLRDARELAARDRFEFEKWACGHVGAEGLFHEPGTKGADGGVDGVLRFHPLQRGQGASPDAPAFAIVRVEGGHVTPDAVRALDGTVGRFDAQAGVIVCFRDQMATVEGNRTRDTFDTATGPYPRVQGLAVEDMLQGKRPDLPNLPKRAG